MNPFQIQFTPSRVAVPTPQVTRPAPAVAPRFDNLLGFTRKTKNTARTNLPVTQQVALQTQTPSTQYKNITQMVNNPPASNTGPVRKMAWGEPTWFLFHTLAEKVLDGQFDTIRKTLLEIIYTISTNLPCPTCAEHAKQYMDGINFNSIQTKDQLKFVLFDFHNSVNKRKDYPLFNFNDLGEKYSKAVTVNMVKNFMKHFETKSKSIRLIADDLHRQRIVTILKEWFNNYMMYFTP